MSKNEALIISKRIIPAYQLAALMEDNFFYPHVDCGADTHAEQLAQYLSILIVDIDNPDIQGAEIACQYLALKPELAWFGLCAGGDALAMQQARSMMVGGFFFLSESGMALDCKRGAAQFLHGCKKDDGMNSGTRVGSKQHRPMIASFQPYYA